ncbi:hypothetical protein [Ruminococcus sp.]
MTDKIMCPTDYMLTLMHQLTGSAAIEKEIFETEKIRLKEIKEVIITERNMTIKEWEVSI